ncbi:hypothetical protein Pve01_93180 [Planomonospora venezuelensis]|nr:hypothetical protein Pve01_93180 [Planomonospora venezuelensis]
MFAATFSASMILLRTSMPDDPLNQPEWSDAAATRLKIALALVPIAGIAFLWFVGVVRDRLGDLEDRFFSSVYFGSGLLFLAMVFVSMALAGAIVATADWDASRSSRPEIVAFGRAVMLQVTNVYALRMAAVFMISLGTTWHRSGTAPRWLVVTTYVIALCLLVITSLSLWVALVFPAWVLLVSVYVLVTVRRAGSRLL